MKVAAVLLWTACVMMFVAQHDNPLGRVAGAAFGLFALAASMNVWSNRNDH